MRALDQLFTVAMGVWQVAQRCIIQLGSAWTRQVTHKALIYPIIFTLLLTLFASLGNLHIAEHGNHRIRKVLASTSVISTIAGTGTNSYSGDNGQATSAALNYPTGVAVDTSGK